MLFPHWITWKMISKRFPSFDHFIIQWGKSYSAQWTGVQCRRWWTSTMWDYTLQTTDVRENFDQIVPQVHCRCTLLHVSLLFQPQDAMATFQPIRNPYQVLKRPPILQCPICQRQFTTKTGHQVHMQLHQGKYTNICFNPFSCQHS